MNKIVTLFLLFCACTMAGAQTLTVTPSDSLYITADDSSQFSTINGLIFLHNTRTDSIIVRWHLASDTVPSAWSILFCDNQNCYQLPTSPKTSLPIAPGDSIDMHAEFSPACVAGLGTMRIAATAEKSSNDSVIQTFIFTYQANISNACGVGINNVSSESSIRLFPNPANNEISLGGVISGHTIALEILDLQGRILTSESTTAGEIVTVPVSTLSAGFYLIRVTDIVTNQASVKRFTKI